MTDTPTQTAMPTPEHDGPDAHLSAEGPHELFIVPARSGAHFQANIGGRMLDLADPGSADWVAPTPDDLFVASIASAFAIAISSAVHHRRPLPDAKSLVT